MEKYTIEILHMIFIGALKNEYSDCQLSLMTYGKIFPSSENGIGRNVFLKYKIYH